VTDVTDASFQTAVLERSETVPVVVDLWAPWCGPCRTLGPLIEKVVAETNGAVELAKVNVDENPRVAASFQVQSIPAVFALSGKQVVDSFVGALPEAAIREWIGRLAPQKLSEADELVLRGDEASLRQALELEADHVGAVLGLAELLIARGEPGEALTLLARIPETGEVRRIAAIARLTESGVLPTDSSTREPAAGVVDLDGRLGQLLDRVQQDAAARQEFIDLLETLPEDDPRRASYRRALASRLF
jgi:putative thioredoxin